MPKSGIGVDVFTAAQARVSLAFDNFEKICVSFSAGKDSTVVMEMVMQEAVRRNRKVAVLLVDLEAQYKKTIEHAVRMYKKYEANIDPYWVALPLHLRNAVSVFDPFWLCWDPDAKENWIRPSAPDFAITDESFFPFFHKGMEFEEFVPAFAEWYSDGTPTAFFIGIRAQESYSRYLTIATQYKSSLDGLKYTTAVCENSDSYNFYPIYDWLTDDIWTYHSKFGVEHNEIYDLMNFAGVSIHDQRICQPYGDDQRRGLWLYHLLEPETWARIVARVNGANSGALYSQDSGNINGFFKVTKPAHLTWREFAYVLTSSMPPGIQEHYANKIGIFVSWWEEHGYPDGIPDEADYKLEVLKKVPSWRRVCKALLKNDYWCKGLGFVQQKSQAYQAYLDLMKKRREQNAVADVAVETTEEELEAVYNG